MNVHKYIKFSGSYKPGYYVAAIVSVIFIVFVLLKTLEAVKYCDNTVTANYGKFESRIVRFTWEECRVNYNYHDKIICFSYSYSSLLIPYIPGVKLTEIDGPFIRIRLR